MSIKKKRRKEEKILFVTLFPTGIKVTSFIKCCIKTEVRKSEMSQRWIGGGVVTEGLGFNVCVAPSHSHHVPDFEIRVGVGDEDGDDKSQDRLESRRTISSQEMSWGQEVDWEYDNTIYKLKYNYE
jgi:hypothetical protein